MALRNVCMELLMGLDKRLLDGKLGRSAQHRVLKNMEHAGGIGRRRLKANGKSLVFVVARQVQQAGARRRCGAARRRPSRARARSRSARRQSRDRWCRAPAARRQRRAGRLRWWTYAVFDAQRGTNRVESSRVYPYEAAALRRTGDDVGGLA